MFQNKILIPFVVAGYPTLEKSEIIIQTLIDEGVSCIEIGVPFSDPGADGPVIQRASQIALSHHICLKDIFNLISRLSRRSPRVSFVIFTYLNPIFKIGIKDYAQRAVDSGVTATLAVDLPCEEADDYLEAHERVGLKTVFLASPTTKTERLKKISAASSGFIYYVSQLGVTGERSEISNSLESEIKNIREVSDKKIAVGFGISNADQARQVANISDAVVIGSRYLSLIEKSTDFKEALSSIRALTSSCHLAIRSL